MKMKARLFLLCLCLVPVLNACPSTPTSHNGRETLTVSQELYDKTFLEVLQFLKDMEAIIADGDFTAWKTHCTAEFLALNSDPMRLHELSQKPNLKDRRIVLTSLEDYFIHVFIPSRVSSKLDKIEFLQKNRVKTVTVIENVPYIVYLLEKGENNQWKIGIW